MTADKKLSAQNSRLPFVISCLEIRISVENPYFYDFSHDKCNLTLCFVTPEEWGYYKINK